jgi:hypothetical protein
MKRAASLRRMELPMSSPGLMASTGAETEPPFGPTQLKRFDGDTRRLFGALFPASNWDAISAAIAAERLRHLQVRD